MSNEKDKPPATVNLSDLIKAQDETLLRVRRMEAALSRLEIGQKGLGSSTSYIVSGLESRAEFERIRDDRLTGLVMAILTPDDKKRRERRNSQDYRKFTLPGAGVTLEVTAATHKRVREWLAEQGGKAAFAVAMLIALHVAIWLGLYKPAVEAAYGSRKPVAPAAEQR